MRQAFEQVLAVPGDRPERVSKPSARCVASGSAAFSAAAMQSVGMTSKPTPGRERYRRPRPRVTDRASSKILDLAGDVEIMGAGPQAGLDHRRGGRRERSGAMQHQLDLLEMRRGGSVESEDARLEPQLARQGADRLALAAGEHRAQPAPRRLAGDQLAGVAVGAVDHPGLGQLSRSLDLPPDAGVWRRRRSAQRARRGST